MTLHTQHAAARFVNALQTTLLLGLMMVLGAVIGRMLLGSSGLLLAAGFAFLALASSSSTAPRLVLAMYRARPVAPFESPVLYGMVAELAHRAELPAVPRLYVSPAATANALSLGQSSRPIIVLTRGLLARLDERELAGVLAHEIAHIRNRDLWILGLADSIQRFTRALATFGTILLVFNLPLLLFGGYGVPFELLLLLLFAPAASVLLELALSRTREFEADRTAVELTGDPEGFASALANLEASQRSFWDFFLPRAESRGSRLLRTHPSAEERIRRLLAA